MQSGSMEQTVYSATRQASFQQFFYCKKYAKSYRPPIRFWQLLAIAYGKSKVPTQLNDTHILSWLGLINSIALAWKTKIKYHFSDSQHIGTDSMRRNTFWPNLSVKQVYRALVKPLINPPTAQKSLEQYLGKSEIDWEEVYLTPLKITIESQLRVFQYKILNNVLCLNNRLFKMGYAKSPLCSLCKRENEIVSHLFCNCTFTQQLWKKLQAWVRGYLILPALEPSIIILGV